jgi:hypothetical protein
MKLTQITLAVAMLVAASAASAAVTPADIATARAASKLDTTWLSGASAQAQVIYLGFRDTCDANSASIFTSDASATVPGGLGNFVAYACTSGGRTKVVYHTMDGGSFNAFAPHTNGIKLDRLKEISSNTTCALTVGTNVYNKCAKAGVGYTAADNNVTSYNDTNGPVKPAGGFSDVESKLFASLLLVDPANIGSEAPVGLTQGFGVVVNTTLYRNLQVAQGIYASVAAAITADPSFLAANAPNITSAQYTSIASGSYSTDWSPILGASGVGKTINLARRVDTSGTQAASNAFFLKNPCSGDPAIAGFLSPVASNIVSNVGATSTFAGTGNVFAGAGTTDVKVALNSAEANGKFAIGVVSLENNPAAETNAARKDYHFVKLDGIHPELADATYARAQLVSAAYQFQFESSYYVATAADAFGASLIPTIVTNIATATNCTTDPIARGLALTAGGTGVPASCVTTMVAKGTRSGNSCTAIQLF